MKCGGNHCHYVPCAPRSMDKTVFINIRMIKRCMFALAIISYGMYYVQLPTSLRNRMVCDCTNCECKAEEWKNFSKLFPFTFHRWRSMAKSHSTLRAIEVIEWCNRMSLDNLFISMKIKSKRMKDNEKTISNPGDARTIFSKQAVESTCENPFSYRHHQNEKTFQVHRLNL